MDSFVIRGGRPVGGTVEIKGNKNAALPMIAAALLVDGEVRLGNVPDIRDVRAMSEIASSLGAQVEWGEAGRVRIEASSLNGATPDPALCGQIRASFLFAGPLLARRGEAALPRPGGDRIGRRPLDTHVHALRELGVEVELEPGRYLMRAPRGLRGAAIFLHETSVMATENVLMAAVLAEGTTVIHNAASEPHVQDLCRMLVGAGASIDGVGTNRLVVEGVSSLRPVEAGVGPDHIELGSFVALAALTGGELRVPHVLETTRLPMVRVAFARLGIRWEEHGSDMLVPGNQELAIQEDLHGAVPKIEDGPWPAFPADLTSIALVAATQSRGTILIHEKMFESRLFWVDRLIGMGARIVLCDPHRAVVVGPSRLYAQTLTSPDIRAGMALLIAALCARGESEIFNISQIERGYEALEARLAGLGADIERRAAERG
jgi:UDP-N-acetylglucosamine 1-carboxyvinyltransferase